MCALVCKQICVNMCMETGRQPQSSSKEHLREIESLVFLGLTGLTTLDPSVFPILGLQELTVELFCQSTRDCQIQNQKFVV